MGKLQQTLNNFRYAFLGCFLALIYGGYLQNTKTYGVFLGYFFDPGPDLLT